MPSATPTHPLLRLGKYTVLEHVATGGMAAIYRARNEETGAEVALKVLPPDFAENPVRLKRFAREARAAARLQHENIVRVYECDFAAETYFIAMEFVDGPDLFSYVASRRRLPFDEVVDILAQAARALSHAYFQGIVHRDIKPSNLLLSFRPSLVSGRESAVGAEGGSFGPVGPGEWPLAAGSRMPPLDARQPMSDSRQPLLVKLTDFGLALDWTVHDESRLTRQGTTIGTVDYMAPEQARGTQLVDIRSDLYALGCTAYFMLTCRPPFAEGALPDKLYKHVHATPPDPRDFRRGIPDELIVIIGKLLQKRPEDRYQTPAELLIELEKLQRPALITGLSPLATGIGGDGAAKSEPPNAGPGTATLERQASFAGEARRAGRSPSLEGKSPVLKPKPVVRVQAADVQPRWSIVAEAVSNALVYMSDPWVLAIGMTGLLAVVIAFLLAFWPS